MLWNVLLKFQWCIHKCLRQGFIFVAEFTEREKDQVGQEMSDVLLYLVDLANKCHIDLPLAVKAKMEQNGRKYPVDKAYGRANKYTDLWHENCFVSEWYILQSARIKYSFSLHGMKNEEFFLPFHFLPFYKFMVLISKFKFTKLLFLCNLMTIDTHECVNMHD